METMLSSMYYSMQSIAGGMSLKISSEGSPKACHPFLDELKIRVI